MVSDHTLETSELRRKIIILTEKIEAAPPVVHSLQTSNEFNDLPNDLDGLTMSPDWDPYIWVNDVMDSEQQQPSQPKAHGNETTLVVAQRRKENFSVDDTDKPVASGLLLMLLLCGAFVASRSSGKSAPSFPRMPDEVRAASATILDNVLKDAGTNAPSAVQPTPAVSGMEPGPSAPGWLRPNAKSSGLAGNTLSTLNGNPSSLETLSNQVMNPSKDQEAEAIFSMTAAQYNSLTSTEFTRRVYSVSSDDDPTLSPPSSNGGGRKNLAETLRVMRDEARGNNAAEVYTRSLLWDRIPTEVVREFKRMVEESTTDSGSGGDWNLNRATDALHTDLESEFSSYLFFFWSDVEDDERERHVLMTMNEAFTITMDFTSRLDDGLFYDGNFSFCILLDFGAFGLILLLLEAASPFLGLLYFILFSLHCAVVDLDIRRPTNREREGSINWETCIRVCTGILVTSSYRAVSSEPSDYENA
jgi:hypothetical protein